MNKTSSDYFEKRLKTPSFWEKIRQKIKIWSLSEQEVDAMKKGLINEAKPLFVASRKSNDKIDTLIVHCFDERIETLPKRQIYNLYNKFIDFKNADWKRICGNCTLQFYNYNGTNV